MSMPKGYKSENGYATAKTLDGKTYHEIADVMNENGFKMNHSTARNVFIQSLIKIASQLTALYELGLKEQDLKRIAIDPRFQSSVRHYMSQLDEWKNIKSH